MYKNYFDYNMVRNNYTDDIGMNSNNFNSSFLSKSDLFNEMNNGSFNSPLNSYNSNMMTLFSPSVGFSNGNLFSNLYSEYKNYNPKKLVSNNPKMKLWLEMSENFFAAHEINLYLDINPNDNSMIELFNDYRRKAESLKKQYEKMYGPLCTSSDALDASPFLWVKDEFPWEGGNI